MKKIFTLAAMMVLGLAVTGWAELWCPDCDLDKYDPSCVVPKLCQGGSSQSYACNIVEPCNPIISVCDCEEGAFFKEGDKVGVSIKMLTPGVYWAYGDDIKVKLFPFMNASNGVDANDACDFRDGSADNAIADWDFVWDAADSLAYLHGTTLYPMSTVTGSISDQTTCTPLPITDITTCSKDSWELDVNPKEDNDDDGFSGEDGYVTIGADKYQKKYLLIDIPRAVINYSEVVAAGLIGTVAQAKICILDAYDSENSICTGCEEVCCCTIDIAQLCDPIPVQPEVENCIYFPYAVYGAMVDGIGYGTGLVISNISYDPQTGNTKVAYGDMEVTFTVVDSKGNVFTGVYDAFDGPVQAFNVDALIAALGFEDVEPGALYISATANFAVDGESITFMFANDSAYGAGTLARCCSGPCNSTD